MFKRLYKGAIVLLLALLVWQGFVLAAPPTTPYAPGETLDPGCSPGDTNCTVDDTPQGAGTQVQFNDYGTFGASSGFTYATSTGTLTNAGEIVANYFTGTSTTATSTFAGGIEQAGTFINFDNIVSPFFTATSTAATSTFSGGLSVAGFAVTGSATSTFVNGISIAGGCLEINGTCISAGGISDHTFPFTARDYGNATSTTLGFENGFLSTASSTLTDTLYAKDAIFSSWIDASYFFATSTVATSTLPNITATNVNIDGLFQVDGGVFFVDSANDRVGVGTTSPWQTLSVSGNAFFEGAATSSTFHATSTTATSTIAGSFSVGSGALKYDYGAQLTSIDNLEIGAASFPSNAGIITWIDMPVTSAASSGVVQSYTAGIDGNDLLTIYSESDGSGGTQNRRVGVATSTPWKTFSVTGTASISGLTAASGSSPSALCLTGENEIVVNSGTQTCTVSSIQFKHDVNDALDQKSLDIITALRPVTFEYNNATGTHYGLIAEEVDLIEPLLVARDVSGNIRSLRFDDMISVLVGAIKELNRKVEALSASAVSGFTSLKDLVLEKLTVGSKEKPTGITFYDKATGEPYCLTIENGETVTTPGVCSVSSSAEDSSLENSGEAENNVDENATSTPEIIIEDGSGTSTLDSTSSPQATPPVLENGTSTPEVLGTSTPPTVSTSTNPIDVEEEKVLVEPVEPAPVSTSNGSTDSTSSPQATSTPAN